MDLSVQCNDWNDLTLNLSGHLFDQIISNVWGNWQYKCVEILAAKRKTIAKLFIKTSIGQLGVYLEQLLRWKKKGKTQNGLFLEGLHITVTDYEMLSIIHTVVELPTTSS